MNKVYETGPPVYRPYPRRLESLIICRYHYKDSTFSLSDSTFSLRPWVLVRPGFELTTSRSADRRSPYWANRAAVRWLTIKRTRCATIENETKKQSETERRADNLLCGLHEVYRQTMLRADLFIYLFVYESQSRGPVSYGGLVWVSHLCCRVISRVIFFRWSYRAQVSPPFSFKGKSFFILSLALSSLSYHFFHITKI